MSDLIIEIKSLEEQEEEILDDISSSLTNLQGMSNEINGTLKKQDRMLYELDTEMEEAQTFMGINIKKINRILSSPNNRKICCIVLLLVVALLLLFLVIYL